MTRRKLWVLLFLAAALVAIVILASSVTQLEFLPGEPFSLGSGPLARPAPAAMPPIESPLITLIIRVLSLVLAALLPFSIIYLIISPEARRRVLPNLVLLGLIILLINYLRRQPRSNEERDLFAGLRLGAPAEGMPAQPTAEFSSALPDWFIVLANFLLAAFVIALVMGILGAAWRRSRQRPVTTALEQLVEQAQVALDTIEAGGDVRNTVIRCYAEMNRVVQAERGLQRQAAMTPREFEEPLTRAGLPAEHVRELTRLFEAVRYGEKSLPVWEERRAVSCLTAIVQACKVVYA